MKYTVEALKQKSGPIHERERETKQAVTDTRKLTASRPPTIPSPFPVLPLSPLSCLSSTDNSQLLNSCQPPPWPLSSHDIAMVTLSTLHRCSHDTSVTVSCTVLLAELQLQPHLPSLRSVNQCPVSYTYCLGTQLRCHCGLFALC